MKKKVSDEEPSFTYAHIVALLWLFRKKEASYFSKRTPRLRTMNELVEMEYVQKSKHTLQHRKTSASVTVFQLTKQGKKFVRKVVTRVKRINK